MCDKPLKFNDLLEASDLELGEVEPTVSGSMVFAPFAISQSAMLLRKRA